LNIYNLEEQRVTDKVEIAGQVIWDFDLYTIHQSDEKLVLSSDGQIGLAPNNDFMQKFG